MQYNWVVMQLKQFFSKLDVRLRSYLGNSAWVQVTFFFLCLFFSLGLMFFSFSYRDGQFLVRSYLWSDFAAHLPLMRSFSLGDNFPPEYPQYANEPIRYHFLFYFLVGWLEKLGLNLVLALNLLSALGLAVLLMLIFKLAMKFYGAEEKGAILAGSLAVILFLFNSSLSFVDYFQEKGWTMQSVVQMVQVEEFVNFGPWNGDEISAFWNWNIFTNQRHLAFSFALALLVAWPILTTASQPSSAIQKSQTKPAPTKIKMSKIWIVVVAIILPTLPFFNMAAYVVALGMIGLGILFNPLLLKAFFLPYLAAISLSVPSFYYFWRHSNETLHFFPGFLAESRTILGVVYYWWRNLGLYIVLWPTLFLISSRQLKKFLLISTVFFLVANLFQLSTDMINNHKLINFFQLGMAVALGVNLAKIWVKSWAVKPIIVLVLLLLTLSGVLDASAVLHDRKLVISDPVHSELGDWVLKQTPPDSVFVTTSYMYHPVSLLGRKTYLDYGYFAWSMGYQDSARRERLSEIFAAEIELDDWCELMYREKIDYVAVSPGKGELDLEERDSWMVRENSPEVRSTGNLEIYSVNKICSKTIQEV